MCKQFLDTLRQYLQCFSKTPVGSTLDSRITDIQAAVHEAEMRERAAKDQVMSLLQEKDHLRATIAQLEFSLEKSTNELYRARDRFAATERRATDAERHVAELESLVVKR